MDKIKLDLSRDKLLSEQATQLLKDYYMIRGESSPQEAFARATALEYETQQGQFTIFGHPNEQTNYYPAYQPFHALRR